MLTLFIEKNLFRFYISNIQKSTVFGTTYESISIRSWQVTYKFQQLQLIIIIIIIIKTSKDIIVVK
jgi:hypothetical protein